MIVSDRTENVMIVMDHLAMLEGYFLVATRDYMHVVFLGGS